MLNNASWIELLYTAFMLCAFGASMAGYLWARARRRELQQRNEDGVVLALRRGAESDLARLTVMCVFMVVIGVNALFAPPNPRAATMTALISGVAFIALSVVMFWLVVSIWQRPNKLRRARDKEAHQ